MTVLPLKNHVAGDNLDNNESNSNDYTINVDNIESFILNTTIIPVSSEPIILNCSLNNSDNIKFELDSGAGISLISDTVAHNINAEISSTTCRATAYDGGVIDLSGKTCCSIRLKDKCCSHTFLVTKGNNINLFGRDLLAKFNFHIVNNPFKVNSVSDSILSEFNDYLSDEFQSNVEECVKLDMPKDAKPI